MTASEVGTIYGLVDPRTGQVRYVGQTTKPIEARLAGHLAAPAPLVRAWIEALAVEGCLPQILPLREGVTVAQLDAAEREEIRAHAGESDLLNVASNELGNAKRRKISREEAKRRKAEEEAVDRTWRQATWRQVADQIRDATGGPISPADIPIREIPAAAWEAYLAYHEAGQRLKATLTEGYLLRPGFGVVVEGDTPEDQERRNLHLQRSNAQTGLEHYLRAYCETFSSVDAGDRWGSGEGIFRRGADAYEGEFRDATHFARYLSLIPWAGRAMDPWIILAEEAGIDKRSPEFTEWVSDDHDTREAIELYQQDAPSLLGVRYQAWDMAIADFMLGLGAAQIPGFVVPDLLTSDLEKRLTELARDRQATSEMCQLLQSINPTALDAVYGRDRLAESDAALGLPPGTSAKVVRHVYGCDSDDPTDRAAKLIQRHTGQFDVVGVPAYSDWKGIHIPAMRVGAASFCLAGLFPAAGDAARAELVSAVKGTWMPSEGALQDLEELEEGMRRAYAARAS